VTSPSGPWPELAYGDWNDTFATLHMELQILGKVRVALSPKEPEWGHVALYVTSRGITTGPVPHPAGIFEVEADLVDHQVVLRPSAGEPRTVALTARPVAHFWRDFVAALPAIGVDVDLPTMPQEVPDPIPFPDDDLHQIYEPELAHRFWRILTLLQPVFGEYRAAFTGRVTPVHFFWGSMDLAVTRFSGAPCQPPPGADFLLRGTYDLEQMSAGWWPGSDRFPRPAFYAYAYPKPPDVEQAGVQPPAAYWDTDLGEHILDYDDVRGTADPGALVREFFESVYATAARSGGWDATLVARGPAA
jgi:hypothetical protein